MDSLRWGIIGFGEAGSSFARHISRRLNGSVRVTDPLLSEVPLPDHIRMRMEDTHVEVEPNIASLASACDVVLSLVNPAAAAGVTAAAGPAWRQGLFIDLNSVSPVEKQTIANYFPAETFVDGAILGSIAGTGASTRLALAGPSSKLAHSWLTDAGFNATVVGDEVGAASALKMCRSVFMKGIECLLIESLLAARQFEIAESVLDSIEETFSSYGLVSMVKMLVTTHAVHCDRRAVEMSGVSVMLDELGMPHRMTDASHDFLISSGRSGISHHFKTTVPGDTDEVFAFLSDYYKENKRA